jgi:alginate O-acetyltransferase complex protein AlgJ
MIPGFFCRYISLAAISILALPLVVSIVSPDSRSTSAEELRKLAAVPEFPHDLTAWLELPARVDAYVHDHFGLRSSMIHAEAQLNQRLLRSGTSQALYADNGWMFYRYKPDGDMLRQSAGLLRREKQVAYTADLLAAMKVELSSHGTALVVAPPPNSSTIYEEKLPAWARGNGRRTEYDLFLDDLATRGVTAVDLRPPLRKAKAHGQIYFMHDTHWTPRGALIAFDVIVEAAAHPAWRINADAALGALTDIKGGGLANMLGIGDDVSEAAEPLTIPDGLRQPLSGASFGAFSETGDRAGPTVMIIGDSFTVADFPQMLLQHVGRIVWFHHEHCYFNWKWIDEFHPDEVWWMPTERYLVCSKVARPFGFPGPK